MRKISILSLIFLVFLSFLTACSTKEVNTGKKDLIIFAGAGFVDLLKEVKTVYEGKNKDVNLIVSLGSAGDLLTQIENGAKSDIYFVPSKSYMKQAIEKGLVDQTTNVDLLQNEVVLITGKNQNSKANFKTLQEINFNKLALGYPESVPAGQYAKQTLEHLKIWSNLEPKIIYGKDVRQVLSYVESGNADLGIVYRTDALSSQNVQIIDTALPEWHKPIIGTLAITKNAQNLTEAKKLIEFLQSEEGKKISEKYGFIPLSK